MVAELWIINILKIVFLLLGAHIAITKIVPLLNDFLNSFIKDKRAVDSFTSLIDIFILVTVGLKIVEFALAVQNKALSYVEVLQPGFEVISNLFSYIQWILLALIVVVALKNYKA